MGYFLDPIKLSDVFEGVNCWGEATVKAEVLVFDCCRDGEIVEKVCKVLPDIWVSIFSAAFIVETVDLGDLS